FFSSRRRHTRFSRDWSSDVCSSDLGWGTLIAFAVLYGKETGIHNSGVFFLFLAGGIILSRVTSGRFVDKGYLHKVMITALFVIRSEERRVGKECRSRRSQNCGRENV